MTSGAVPGGSQGGGGSQGVGAGAPLHRAASPHVLFGAGSVTVFGPRPEDACAFEGDSAGLVEAILEGTAAPIARDDLVRKILADAGADEAQRTPIDAAVDLLLCLGALVRGSAAPAVRPASGVHGRVLLCVTGAIASVYAPALAERLVSAGHEVRVAMTRAARRFVHPRSFAAVTHHAVTSTLWRGAPDAPAPHIELSRWADAVVVYPCSATTLSRVAAGDCSEVVSATVTATRAPVLLAPSMNVEMLRAPAVEDALARVRERGFFLAHPALGVEVADAPDERVRRAGVAAPAPQIVRYVSFLLARAQAGAPALLSRAEWDAELATHALAITIDDDFAAALASHTPAPARVLEVGAGLGAMARALSARGYAVVATDFSRRAIERAAAAEGAGAVTWAVDDVTDSSLAGTFDACVDRACLGCVPEGRRARYAAAVAKLVRPGGHLMLKVHEAPARPMRAHAFARDALLALFSDAFEVVACTPSTLSFGAIAGGPALFAVLRRRS